PAIEQCIARGARTAGLLASVRVRVVEEDDIRHFDPELASFVNVNTPEEYAVLLERLAAS
ncbi:MAG TPA: molybdenum cofactor guanylyltransferase, partial [bacterium]|nr:molybdenum cofactor guanylyltransferase [bacterium]